MKSIWLKRCFLLGMVLAQPTLSQASSHGSFDGYFQQSHDRFLSWHDPDWGWLYAQGVAESSLDPLAVSAAGARGVMQFMPAAWSECMAALGINASPHHPRASILCGGWYMRRMLLIWSEPRSRQERWRWAWGSYNWGAGNVLRAQKRVYGSVRYSHIEPHLPRETRQYVLRIERIHGN